MADGNAPPVDPSGTPPSGEVSETATCCPLVSTFDGSPRPERVFGYDFRTNLVDTRGSSEEYWTPAAKGKSAPSDRYTRDGAAWASVGLGMEADLEISFEGHSGNGCLMNCRFEPEGAGVVELVTQTVNRNKAVFTVRGASEGETTLVVTCDGAEIGWIHIVCYAEMVIPAVIGCVKGSMTRDVAYDLGDFTQFLNRAFRQALIRFEVEDIGLIDLRGNPTFAAMEVQSKGIWNVPPDKWPDGWPPVDLTTDAYGDLTNREHVRFVYMIEDELIAMPVELYNAVTPYIEANYPGKFSFIYFVPNDLPMENSGVAVGFRDPAFVFRDFTDAHLPGYGIRDSYSVLCHEAGHCFGLQHPGEQGSGEQVPQHLLASIGSPVSYEAATNTHIAVDPQGKPVYEPRNATLIMARDPLNMMGYWPAFQEQTKLVKLQWDKARAGAKTLMASKGQGNG